MPKELAEFGALSDDALSVLSVHARPQSFDANTVIYYQDDPSTHMHILSRGNVRLSYIAEDGFVTLFTILAPTQAFGAQGLLGRTGHLETASTVGSAEVISVDCVAWLDRPGAPYDELRMALARMVGKHFRRHQTMTRGLYLPNLGQRLAHSLLNLLGSLGNEIRYEGELRPCIGPEVTQRDLGAMARGTRENVNKTLRRWRRDGIIVMEDRHIVVLDLEGLRDMSMSLD
ncbi:MAG: Crp/Fnr family transcriptional regulator [Paracoccaceae bacterium]